MRWSGETGSAGRFSHWFNCPPPPPPPPPPMVQFVGLNGPPRPPRIVPAARKFSF